jgi:short subunit dehydrogenase-like uncharacterized protein
MMDADTHRRSAADLEQMLARTERRDRRAQKHPFGHNAMPPPAVDFAGRISADRFAKVPKSPFVSIRADTAVCRAKRLIYYGNAAPAGVAMIVRCFPKCRGDRALQIRPV